MAEAIVFLLDGGEDDAADILLGASARFEPRQVPACEGPYYLDFRSFPVTVLSVSLTVPRRAFDTLRDQNAPESPAIHQAFAAVWRAVRGPLVGDGAIDAQRRPIRPVEITLMYGRTNPALQARMTQLVKSMTANYRKVEGIQVVQQGEPITLRPIPIFPTGPFQRDDRLCFVIMPFAPQFQAVYEVGIKPGVNTAGLRCLRGDDIMRPGDILGQIWGSLMAARFVVADLTGANGNVLYELGLAHVVGHQAILLTQNMADVPFDLRQQRHIVYAPTQEGLWKLHAELRTFLQQLVAETARA